MQVVVVSPVRLGQTFADEDRVIEEHRHSGVTLLHELDVENGGAIFDQGSGGLVLLRAA